MLQTEQAALRGSLSRYLQPAPNRGFYICPLCGSGSGPNKTGALHIGDDGVHCKCFACGFYGDIFDLIGSQYGLSGAEQFKKTEQLLLGAAPAVNVPMSSRKPRPSTVSFTLAAAKDYLSRCAAALHSAPATMEYLKGRGFSDETIRRFSLGWDEEARQIVLPYPGNDSYFIRRGIGKKKHYYKPPSSQYGPEPLFNAPVLETERVVFVVESQFCAISIAQAGGAAVALGGTGVSRLLRAVENCSAKPRFVLCFDNDTAGQDACALAREALVSAGCLVLCCDLSPGFKDPNEALQADPAAFSAQVSAAVKGALALLAPARPQIGFSLPTSCCASSQVEELLLSLDDAPQDCFPSGFAAVDAALDGGFHAGLYVLGALPSLGKTTFALQLADQLAAAGKDVLFFSLEMSVSELLAKSLSRLSHSAGLPFVAPLSVRDVLSGCSPAPSLRALADTYKTFSHRLFFHECMGSDSGLAFVSDMLRKHVDATGRHPVVIIDYLQILKPPDARATDKQNIDRAVLALKRLSRDYSVPVLAISSLNREHYSAKMSLAAFKESGAIEYSSDVLLGLQFRTGPGEEMTPERIDVLKQASARAVELRVLKNRNGRTGEVIPFVYYAERQLFCPLPVQAAASARR